MKHLILLFILSTGTTFTNAEVLIEQQLSNLYSPKNIIQESNLEVEFWANRLKENENSTNHKKLAEAYGKRFQIMSNISDLKSAEKHLIEALNISVVGKSGMYRALAHNYISQHRFCEALEILIDLKEWGSQLRAPQMMIFDCYMELGRTSSAKMILEKLESRLDFDYYIRNAKFEDVQGRLNNAIESLEIAMIISESSNDFNKRSWIYSNIADFYGHNGEIEKSKDYFIKALKINAADWYSLKGLAWIAYSKDNNPDQSLDFLQLIEKYNTSPSITKLKAEIIEYSSSEFANINLKTQMYNEVKQSSYGTMHNAFLVDYYISIGENEKSLKLAYEEIRNRATPDSYILLVMSYLALNEQQRALEISERYIVDQTFEPGILIELVELYQDHEDQYQWVKNQLIDCRYELSPVQYSRI